MKIRAFRLRAISDLPDTENLKLLKRLSESSPVYNTLTHGVPVGIEIERK
ncbi:MAG: hypothetical protein QUT30_13980 [Acidobacteriota bacterium]|nr:hypothetical protein [Acidobacteriota bacterium]